MIIQIHRIICLLLIVSFGCLTSLYGQTKKASEMVVYVWVPEIQEKDKQNLLQYLKANEAFTDTSAANIEYLNRQLNRFRKDFRIVLKKKRLFKQVLKSTSKELNRLIKQIKIKNSNYALISEAKKKIKPDAFITIDFSFDSNNKTLTLYILVSEFSVIDLDEESFSRDASIILRNGFKAEVKSIIGIIRKQVEKKINTRKRSATHKKVSNSSPKILGGRTTNVPKKTKQPTTKKENNQQVGSNPTNPGKKQSIIINSIGVQNSTIKKNKPKVSGKNSVKLVEQEMIQSRLNNLLPVLDTLAKKYGSVYLSYVTSSTQEQILQDVYLLWLDAKQIQQKDQLVGIEQLEMHLIPAIEFLHQEYVKHRLAKKREEISVNAVKILGYLVRYLEVVPPKLLEYSKVTLNLKNKLPLLKRIYLEIKKTK